MSLFPLYDSSRDYSKKLSQMEQSLCDTLRRDDAAAAHISMD